MSILILIIILSWIVSSVATPIILDNKGYSVLGGIFIGLFFGPIALLVALLSKSKTEATTSHRAGYGIHEYIQQNHLDSPSDNAESNIPEYPKGIASPTSTAFMSQPQAEKNFRYRILDFILEGNVIFLSSAIESSSGGFFKIVKSSDLITNKKLVELRSSGECFRLNDVDLFFQINFAECAFEFDQPVNTIAFGVANHNGQTQESNFFGYLFKEMFEEVVALQDQKRDVIPIGSISLFCGPLVEPQINVGPFGSAFGTKPSNSVEREKSGLYKFRDFLEKGQISINPHDQKRRENPFNDAVARKFFNNFKDLTFNFTGRVGSIHINQAKMFDNGYGYAHGFISKHSLENSIALNDMGVVGEIRFQLGDMTRDSIEPEISVKKI